MSANISVNITYGTDSSHGKVIGRLKKKQRQAIERVTKYKDLLTTLFENGDTGELKFIKQITEKRNDSIEQYNKETEALIAEDKGQKAINDAELMELDETFMRTLIKVNEYISILETKTEKQGRPNLEPVKMKMAKLPEIKLKSFSGKFKEWLPFYDTFTNMVDCRTDISDVEKFQYLLGCLRGEAKKTLEGFTLTAVNYKEAVELLKGRFANNEAIINGLMENMVCVREIEDPWDTVGLRQMCDRLEPSVKSAQSMGVPSNRYEELLVPLVSSKLPLDILLPWMEKKPEHSCNTEEFLNFLKGHVRLKERAIALK